MQLLCPSQRILSDGMTRPEIPCFDDGIASCYMFRSPGIAMFRFSQSHGLFPQRPWRKIACQGCCSESTYSGDAAETFHGGGFFRNRPHPKKNSQIHIQKRSKLLERKLGRLAVSCSWWQESNSRPLLYGLRWGCRFSCNFRRFASN